MKPESVDNGSLEKLAEKALDEIHKLPYTAYIPALDWKHEIEETGRAIILSALSEATAALEEKVKQFERDLDWTRDNATEHCRRADTAEAAVGENCRRIEELKREKSAVATTRSPMGVVSEETGNALKEAYRALDAIESIVGDDFCSELEYRTLPDSSDPLTGDLKTCEEKIGMIYMISHSENPNHSCHDSHDSWRGIKNEVLKGVGKVGDKQPRTMAQKKD